MVVKRQISFLFVLFFFLFDLTAIEPVVVNEKVLRGYYIGQHIEYLSEKDLFQTISDQWNVEQIFVDKMLSGLLHSDNQIDFQKDFTDNGYRARLSSQSNQAVVFWGIEEILTEEVDVLFQKSKKSVFTLNFTRHAYWLKIQLINESNKAIPCYLEYDKHLTGTFDFYFLKDHVWQVKRKNFTQPLQEREVQYKHLVVPVKLQPGNNTFYIRVDGNYLEVIPIRFWSEDYFRQKNGVDHSIQGFLTGLFFIIIVYSVVIYLMARNITYLYLSFIALSNLLFHWSISGFGFQFFWGSEPKIGVFLFFTLFPFVFIFNLLFCRNFLETQEHTPRLDLLNRIMIYFSLILFILMMLLPQSHKMRLFLFTYLFDYIYLLPAGISAVIIFQKGSRLAVFIILGIMINFLAQIEYVFSSLDIIPYQFINYLNIRSISYTIIITIGLTTKFTGMNQSINKLRQLKELLQEEIKKLKGTKKSITEETKTKIQIVQNYIQENYTEVITRDSLSYAVGYSPDHLGRVFKQHTGERISDYLNKIRIQAACRQLEQTNRPIIDIAFATGFESLRTFNKIFFDLNHETPTQFRQNKRK
ncbi:MAG: helix-turn-helix domain-containing protein [Spirochaetes bacterium]|nr:helix-turn-helix domain-containing protein [Spirochaetota bacterium]